LTAQHHRGVTRHVRNPLHRLSAIGQLLAVLSLPPALLLALVGSPLEPPAPLRTVHALTTAVDDRSLLWLVAVAAWFLYAHLVASLLIEALRQTRGSHLRLPMPGLMFGANAALASHLIASLVLTTHPGGGTGDPATARLTPAVVRVATTTAMVEHASITARHAPPAAAAPPAVVDSQEVTAGSPDHVPATGTTAGRAPIQCRVLPPDGRDHDTLWDIAERHLGDGTRWRDVYALNHGRLMPDGRRLTHASLIHPGWILTLPADAVALDSDRIDPPVHAAVDDAHARVPAPIGSAAQDADGQRPHQAPPDTSALPTLDNGTAARAAVPTPAVAQSRQHLDHSAAAPTSPPDHTANGGTDTDQDLPVQVAGVLGIAAIGLLAALSRRRKIASRRRPPGARTALPGPDLLAEEQRIRHLARLAQDTCAAVRLALLLAVKAAPGLQLKAVWQHPDGGLELIWTEQPSAGRLSDAAPAPFEKTDRGWLLPTSAQRFLYLTQPRDPHEENGLSRLDTELAGRSDAFPLLLPVGSRDGSACLVNLESYGLISLLTEAALPEPTAMARTAERPPPHPLELVGAWVQALAGAPWAEPVRIRVPEQLADAAVGLEHVSVAERADYDGELPADLVEQVSQAGSFSAARRVSDGVDESISEVLAGYPLELAQPAALTAATDPAQPLMLLLLDPHPDASTWTLRRDGRLSIPEVAEDLTPLQLDPARQQRLLRLLEHAQDPPQITPDNPHRQSLREQCPPQVDPHQTAGPPTLSGPVIDLREHTPPPALPDSTDLPADASASAPAPAPAPAAAAGLEAKNSRGTDPDPDFAGPMEIGVLGPVTITGPDRPQPRETSMQMLLYMAFHRRPLSGQQLWEGLWPNDPYQATTSRTRRSELKQYIKPLLTVSQGPRYRVDDLVKTDWQRFQSLADGNPAQQLAALALIRGVPFQHAQLDWVHLEGHFGEIEASIIDLALDVAGRAMRQRDYDTARTASLAGLRGAPYEERLYRVAMQSAAARGATSELQHLRRQLAIVIEDELEPDDAVEPATSQLLHELDEKLHRRAALGRRLDSS
jgi:DNA-binding SARP family transcriptional activator